MTLNGRNTILLENSCQTKIPKLISDAADCKRKYSDETKEKKMCLKFKMFYIRKSFFTVYVYTLLCLLVATVLISLDILTFILNLKGLSFH